jgi:hypothetical protein
MSDYAVKYWLKTSDTTLEPFACTKQSLKIEMGYRNLSWCRQCNAVVDPEGQLDADGLFSICPFCDSEVD